MSNLKNCDWRRGLITNPIDVLLEFLNMPLQSTDHIFAKFFGIDGAIRRGHGLEQFLYVRGERNNKVLLVAHADTVWDSEYSCQARKTPEIAHEDGIIWSRSGGFGADDRAGCAIVWLLRDLGHSLLITSGEEQGQKGSCWLRDVNKDIFEEINDSHQFVVQFDRQNGRDFKCYSVGTDEFRDYIINVTSYTEPNRKRGTDINTICERIAGVNLSIGFYNEHTDSEYLVVEEWLYTMNLCRKWLAEYDLPKFKLKGGSGDM